MKYRTKGTIFHGPVIDENVKDFTLEIEADSPQEAGNEARRQVMASNKRNLLDEDVKIWDIQIVTGEPLDELSEWIREGVSKKWLTGNHHLVKFGYPQDTLSKDFGHSQAGGGPKFRYVHPGTNTWSDHIRTKFPQEMAPLIRVAVCNKQEAEKAIELIFARIKVVEEPETDGNHHSITYGEPAFLAYYIVADEAFELASKTQELKRLI